MQTWAKRGIQTALVTGGLLMLGTGIASADENVNPDTPAGPLDVTASIPVDISKNAVGTLGKQVNLPEVHKEISTKPITDKLNSALAPVTKTEAYKSAAPAMSAANQVTSKATAAASQVGQSLGKGGVKRSAVTPPSVESNGDPLMGNKVAGNVAVPILISGNAVGVLGNASVDSDETQTYENYSDVNTSGAGGGLAGNAVNLDWALPIQISGNAGGLGGSGKTSGSATQSATTSGNTTTDGTNGGVAGNVIAPQGATPVQVSGNAIGWFLGHAETDFDGSSSACSGGYVETHGSEGAGTGNVAGAPIALPVKVSNNAASWGGDADAAGNSTADAAAGGVTPGMNDIPSYIQTDGDDSFLAGNIVQPQGAVPASAISNAASFVGNSAAGSGFRRQAATSGSTAQAGGFSSTTGQNATGSGNIADAPAAAPVSVSCAAGAAIGTSGAGGCDTNNAAGAGGGTYTNGNNSVVSGNSASAQPAGAAGASGVGAAGIGNASGSSDSTTTANAGGYNGSQGNDSTVSGNVAQLPVALPGDASGTGASAIGQGSGTATTDTNVSAGGGGNTQDDHGTGSANLVAVPVSTPVPAGGIGGAAAGQAHGKLTSDTTSQAGGHLNANGKKGFLSGNIGQAPVSLPAPVQGHGVAGAGNAFGEGDNMTDSYAGGDATATGQGGSLTGNIVQVPAGAAAGVVGVGGGAAGLNSGEATSDIVSSAGGSSATNGEGGAGAGNVISGQLMPSGQATGTAANGAGISHGSALTSTDTSSGGDITSSGTSGSVSGNIFDVPAAAVPQAFGDAASAAGVAHAVDDSTTTGTVGGTDTTSGSGNALSGINKQIPVGAVAQVYQVALPVLATATSQTSNDTDISVAGHEPGINLPISPSEMSATSLPKLPALPLPKSARQDLPALPSLPAAGGLPSLPALPAVGGLSGSLPQLPLLPGTLPGANLPSPMVGDLLPQTQLPQGDLPALPSLDAANPTAVLSQVTGAVGGKGMHIQA
ncbi:hypothetical protein [Amycolatopsis sp. GM8]|uniref:beta strand repeat-containing protein n=1 Tax=Amycolatopsis sp. GM8 TaxID=2896530 RepID=UPI001F39817D|nr:hypothetical protein [Amycolatopsis sp. GM8]